MDQDAAEEGTAVELALATLMDVGGVIGRATDDRAVTVIYGTGRDIVGEPDESPVDVLLRWQRGLGRDP